MVDAKAAKKEGGKKGVDVVGMSDLGGVKFFNVTIESAEGTLEGLELVLEGMNAPVDEAAEERKGGAGALGKLLYSAASPGNTVALLCNIPKALAEAVPEMTANEWVDAVVGAMGGTVSQRDEVKDGETVVIVKVLVTADPAKEQFPLKMRDAAQAEGSAFLRRKGQLPADDDDDDYIPDLEAEGITW